MDDCDGGNRTADFSDNTNANPQCPDIEFQIAREWSYEDRCGNEIIGVQTIVVIDGETPDFEFFPDDVDTLQCASEDSSPAVWVCACIRASPFSLTFLHRISLHLLLHPIGHSKCQ